ncbi:MAG: hypothetical protein N0E48_16630 [Candidatus Thiodiazotropha endolucinida]|nr:hypothetical protein [Candidatus Thiodiazotropha endolucinida]
MSISTRGTNLAVLSPANNVQTHNQNIQDNVVYKDYVLNPDKCLRKKLMAAKRQEIEYAVKGGGVVAKLDAVSFELFHISCKDYFSNSTDDILNVSRDSAKDGKGNIVQYTYVVYLKDNTSYTVNLYVTKCSLLINGRATYYFIDKHLPEIHHMMSHIKIQGIPVNIKKLNELLVSQLQKLSSDSTITDFKTPKPQRRKIEFSPKPEDNIACIKCSKNCRKRAVECDSCNRWVHYHCDRLDQTEITFIESTKCYVCKTCNSANTSCITKLPTPKQSPSENTVPKTISQSIMDEETRADCVICCNPLDDNEASCEKCGSICHISCMCPDNPDICLTCAAIDNNIDTNTQNNQSLILNPSPPRNIPNGSEPKQTIDICHDQVLDTNELLRRESEVSNKQKELRQLEQKLKKREDEVKLKEVKLKEYEKNCLKLETKINSLEHRNRELENTVKNMKDRINMLDSNINPQNPPIKDPIQTSGISQPHIQVQSSKLDTLVQGIHDRISAYVLLKVEKQIEHLIDMEEHTSSMDTNINEAKTVMHDNEQPTINFQTTNPQSSASQQQMNQKQDDYDPTHTPYEVPTCSEESMSSYVWPLMDNFSYSTQLTNPSYLHGQPLYYGVPVQEVGQSQQSRPLNEKRSKPFLRHTNLINLVN